MGKKRRKYSDEFKAKGASEAVKGVRTLGELSAKFGVHSTVAWWMGMIEAGTFRLRPRATA